MSSLAVILFIFETNETKFHCKEKEQDRQPQVAWRDKQ